MPTDSPSTTTTVATGNVTSTTAGSDATVPHDPLLTPSGSFLSSHRLSLSGTNGPTDARSVCTTGPGATCVITFTKGGVVKSLPSQQVDGNGSTSWLWSPSNIGLTVGHWDVQIIASSGTEQRSVDEAVGLEVVA